jgi:chorismate mutase
MTDLTLQRFRDSIDNIDASIMYMLAERFKVTKAVGEYKAEIGLPASDPMREKRQIQRLRRLATDANLDPEISEKFLRFIVEEVIRHHNHIKEAKGEAA